MRIFNYCFLFVVLLFSFKSEAYSYKFQNEQKKDSIYYYVIASSGLNYRETPKGKILGKFPLNTLVKVIERTGIFQEIIDEGQLIKGEWVGVVKEENTVYVFDAFLAKNKYEIPFNIYDFQSYEGESKSIGFIVLTDDYPWNNKYGFKVINKEIAQKNSRHILSFKYRKRFLKGIKIKETDTVYVYNFLFDTILKFKVSDLSLLAEPNPYGDSSHQADYIIGFDLYDKLGINKVQDYYNSFVYIGEKNPFVTGNIKPIIWEKTTNESFPSVNFKEHRKYLNTKQFNVLENEEVKSVLTFNYQNYIYYLGSYNEGLNFLVVLKNKKKVFEQLLYDSEGISQTPITIKGLENRNYQQFTGSIFKNKPLVIFGFKYLSFGCPSIDIIDGSSDYIRVLCDNRH